MFEVVLSLILLSAMFLLLPNRPGSFIPSRTIPFLALWAILSLGFVIVTRWYSPDRLFGRVRSVALGAILVSSIGIAMWGYYRNRLELPAGGAEGNPNIILISIDTLRADALSCYGQQVDSSPNIDRLAASGVVFKKAFAPSSWTYPSMASLMTSLPPPAHAIDGTSLAIRRSYTTVAEVMKAHGYNTAAIFGNPLLNSRNGYNQGFIYFDVIDNDLPSRFLAVRLTNLFLLKVMDWRPNLVYRSLIPMLSLTDHRVFYFKTKLYASADEITSEALDFLRDNSYHPFFLHLHYFDPHGPYHAHPKVRLPDFSISTQETLPTSYNLYRGEVTYCDENIGRLLDFLEESGLRKDTYIFLTADHGEGFLEHHVLFHGNDLHAEEVKIPLIAAGPGIVPGRVLDTPVTLTDIGPTIADLAGINAPESFRGSSLVGLLRGEDEGNRMVFSMIRYNPLRQAKHVPIEERREAIRKVRKTFGRDTRNTSQYLLSVRTKDTSFMCMLDRSGKESVSKGKLYDIESDPYEQRDLSEENSDRVAVLKDAILKWYRENTIYGRGIRTPGKEEAPEAEREKLRALGYIF